MSPRIPKKVDPAVSFTCANCKRVRPNNERAADRLVCRDRKECGIAAAEALAKEDFIPKPVAKART